MYELVPTMLARPRRFTRAEYDRLVELGFFQRERIELVDGVLVRMSPIGPRHANTVDRLAKLLTIRLADRATVRAHQPFLASDDSEPEPDIAVVPPGDHGERHPDRALLVVEVADTSLDYDRETKGALYAASGVPEYWIVNLIERSVEIHTLPSPTGRYAQVVRVKADGAVAPVAFPDLTVDVSALLA